MMTEKNLNKKEIIDGSYGYPKRFINLSYTDHFKNRFKERGMSLDIFPSIIRITENNIYSGKIIEGKKYLYSVVIKLSYKQDKDLFMAIHLPEGLVKTIYFKKKNDSRKLKRLS